MGYLLIKFIISAALIVVISEIAKRNSLLGSILASLPLISVLAMIWLYLDTKNTAAVALLSRDIFWLVIPSLVLFLTLPMLLKLKINFYYALATSSIFTVIAYFLMIFILRKFAMKI